MRTIEIKGKKVLVNDEVDDYIMELKTDARAAQRELVNMQPVVGYANHVPIITAIGYLEQLLKK